MKIYGFSFEKMAVAVERLAPTGIAATTHWSINIALMIFVIM
jgi:hypothetical protein